MLVLEYFETYNMEVTFINGEIAIFNFRATVKNYKGAARKNLP